jgi:molecular chaperone HscA
VNEEPTCALATLYHEKRLPEGLHAVCDIGGGTTDAAMIHIDEGKIYLLETDSLPIGGNDFDECLFRHLRTRIGSNRMPDGVLRRECRTLKERLTIADVASLAGVSVSRQDFEKLISEPIGKIAEFLKGYVLDQARKLPREHRLSHVDVKIHLAGGGSLVPLVQEKLSNLGFDAIRTKVSRIRSESAALFGDDLIIFAIGLGNLLDTEGFNLLSLPVDIEAFEDGDWIKKAKANDPFPVEFRVRHSPRLQL